MMAVAFQGSSASISLEDVGALLVFFFGGLYAIYWGFGRWKLSRLIEDTPTEKVRSMAAGRTELEGTVREREGSVNPPYEDRSCVYVNWTAERRERRRDEDGDIEYHWVTIADGTDAYPFHLEDDTGKALIRADRDDPTVDINDEAHREQVTYSKGEHSPPEVREFVGGDQPEPDESENGFIDSAVDTMTDVVEGEPPLEDVNHRRRYHQQVLPRESDVYVLGGARSRSDSTMTEGQQDLLEIRRHDGTDTFLISDTEEEQLQQSYRRKAPLAIAAGLLASGGSLYFLLSMLML